MRLWIGQFATRQVGAALTSEPDILDAAVVGGGWAGLGVSNALMQRGISPKVLESGRIGETWRSQRWDSFLLNTPNSLSVMPGDHYSGPDPDGALTCSEFVALLAGYAARRRLPIEANTCVTELATVNGIYRLTTTGGPLLARNVVIATGDQNCPIRPSVTSLLPAGMTQMDASAYRNAHELGEGAVLVVGSAQSGGQIAEELALAGRTVYLATSRVRRLRTHYRGAHIMVWLLRAGFLDVPLEELQQAAATATRPLTGALRTISLQSLSALGVILLGRLQGYDGNSLLFSEDVAEHVRFADESSVNSLRLIDEYIAREGIDAPEAERDEAEEIAARLPDPPIRTLDIAKSDISTVIWCTGFKGDFSWARVPGLIDSEGHPVHTRGVAEPAGLYFAGLAFAVSRRSGTILAIDEEASRFAESIARRLDRMSGH